MAKKCLLAVYTSNNKINTNSPYMFNSLHQAEMSRPIIQQEHSGITLSMLYGERRESNDSQDRENNNPGSRTPTSLSLATRKRLYSQDLYRYTMSMWNDNRSEIE